MRTEFATLLTLSVLAGPAAAVAAPPVTVPDPTDCHSMNKFLHIDNVRDCDNNSY